MISLRRRTFERWLNQHEEDEDIGRVRSGARCPIAEYLMDHGALNVDVSHRTCLYYHNGLGYEPRTPVWAKLFLETIDKLPRSFVTKQEALHALP